MFSGFKAATLESREFCQGHKGNCFCQFGLHTLTPWFAHCNVSKVMSTLYFPSCLGFSRHVQVSCARKSSQIFLLLLISLKIPQCCKQEAALLWHAESWFFCPWLGVHPASSPSCESYQPSALGSRAPQLLPNLKQKRNNELSPNEEVRNFPTARQRTLAIPKTHLTHQKRSAAGRSLQILAPPEEWDDQVQPSTCPWALQAQSPDVAGPAAASPGRQRIPGRAILAGRAGPGHGVGKEGGKAPPARSIAILAILEASTLKRRYFPFHPPLHSYSFCDILLL